MQKESTPVEVLEAKNTTLTLDNLKEVFFNDMTPLEMMHVLDKIQTDLLCSTLTDDDTTYRSEIIVFSTTIAKIIVALKNNTNPNNINLIELICGEA